MASSHSSNGVFEFEKDLSTRVQGQSTGIGVVVGEFERGEVGVPFLVTDTADLTERTGLPNMKKYGAARYCAEIFLEEARQLWIMRVVKGAKTAGAYFTVDDPKAGLPNINLSNFDDGGNVPQGIISPLENLAFNVGDPGVENVLGFFCAINPGAWNNRISVRVRPSNPRGTQVGSGSHDVYQFYVEVFFDYAGPNDVPVESFLVSRKQENDGDGRQMFIETRINSNSKYIRVKHNPLCPAVKIVKTAFVALNGGTDGDRVSSNQIANAYAAFEDSETQPGNIFQDCGYTFPNVHREMSRVCEARGDAAPLLSVPQDREDLISARSYRLNDLNLNTSYGALYAPFVPCYDKYNDRDVYIPLSAFAARTCAKVDRERNVSHAVAGLRYAQIASESFPPRLDKIKFYNQGARDAMDGVQINVPRRIKGSGVFINGEETLLKQASAFRSLAVRRTISYARRSLAIATMVGVFDPNDEYLRLSLKNLCESWLNPLSAGVDRMFYQTEVVCDERNNTNDVIAAGILKLDIYLDPVIGTKRIHLTANIQGPGTVAIINNG